MLKKFFNGLAKPGLEYIPYGGRLPEPLSIPLPSRVTLIPGIAMGAKDAVLPKIGDPVKTGQKLSLTPDGRVYAISPATGKIAAVNTFSGDLGQSGTAVSIDVARREEAADAEFAAAAAEPALDSAALFLAAVPGRPPLAMLRDPQKSIHTIVINGADTDLLVVTQQYIVQSRMEALTRGIAVLKKISGIDNVILAVPESLMGGYGEIGAKVRFVGKRYPEALPQMILKDILEEVIPAGKSAEDLGICVFNAEAVAAIGSAYEKGRLPLEKVLTVIKKDGSKTVVSARIGTPVKTILKAVGETVREMDRVILGGPMMGIAIYGLDYPVRPDTDALMIQDSQRIPFVSDYPCINCGECIRVCPVNIPINMLVRFLEAGHYREAVDAYDLFSCVECGLCSYVCVSRIPIFQYIRLAKYELGRIEMSEVTNA